MLIRWSFQLLLKTPDMLLSQKKLFHGYYCNQSMFTAKTFMDVL
jgi:hypothetical protein